MQKFEKQRLNETVANMMQIPRRADEEQMQMKIFLKHFKKKKKIFRILKKFGYNKLFNRAKKYVRLLIFAKRFYALLSPLKLRIKVPSAILQKLEELIKNPKQRVIQIFTIIEKVLTFDESLAKLLMLFPPEQQRDLAAEFRNEILLLHVFKHSSYRHLIG